MLDIDETDLPTRIHISISGHIGAVNENIKLVSEICYTDGLELWESHLHLWLSASSSEKQINSRVY